MAGELVAVRDRSGPVGDRGGLQSALGGEVGRDDDARMPEAARRPLQRFCALAALNHGGTPRRRLADPGGQGGVVLCDTARRRGT
jgi:hypothetical protein